MSSSRVYVGNLPLDVREREIEDLFYKYGRIRSIDLKTPSRPPAFAFIDFGEARTCGVVNFDCMQHACAPGPAHEMWPVSGTALWASCQLCSCHNMQPAVLAKN